MGILDQRNLGYKELDYTVFPSEEKTIEVQDDETYGGAHLYRIKLSEGFKDGKTIYTEDFNYIQFVQKDDDGSVTPGLQSEQLAYVLLDRAKKLNARFPSPQNEKQIAGLQMFLDACK